MNCPACKAQTRRIDLAQGLVARQCRECEGRWIPSFQYWRWISEQGDATLPENNPEFSVPAADPGNAMVCPECNHVLVKANVGRENAFQVDRCMHCAGLWLNKDEWANLEEKEIATEIRALCTSFRARKEEPNRTFQTGSSHPARDGFNQISHRKPFFEISDEFWDYLVEYGRGSDLPPIYDKLMEFETSFTCSDRDGNDTLWDTVSYNMTRKDELNRLLARIYSQLRTGDPGLIDHIYIERVDFCEFGNSKPFRVRVVNQFNDNYDHFYVKVPDSSRIYGLELEQTLSPNQVNYLVNKGTLIEEHIAGIPGDIFIRDHVAPGRLDEVRVAKEFVKFNERCFVRLLGDMRSYNYVIDMTPDFEQTQYRVRAIDFDQQCYEGNNRMYLPQFFKENNQVVQLCTELLNYPTMKQYQQEERTLIKRRIQAETRRLNILLEKMQQDELSSPDKVAELRSGLNEYHETTAFNGCDSMGELVRKNLEVALA
ncbi:MAG: zf-TFIIB domain-containing protein [Verrucomicrobiota bacterium]